MNAENILVSIAALLIFYALAAAFTGNTADDWFLEMIKDKVKCWWYSWRNRGV
jgi:hypothetical protein